jgi:hypothetical protein
MYKRPWTYVQNPFMSVTTGNYSLSVIVSTYTDSALNAAKADATILSLYNTYHPLHQALTTAYNDWLTQGGTQKGSTLNLTQLLAQSTSKINDWDLAVQLLYRKDTPQYKTIFPNGHAPYNSGAQTNRIAAVKALSNHLVGITALASTKAAVDAYFTALETANTAQKGNKTTTNTASTAVEIARINTCHGLYAVLGGLMMKYSTQPDKVGDFMDLENIRNKDQTDFTGHTMAGQTSKIAKRTLVDNQPIRLINLGNVKIQFYLSTHPSDMISSKFIIVNPMEDKTVIADDLGDVASQHYLMINNMEPNGIAHWQLIVM